MNMARMGYSEATASAGDYIHDSVNECKRRFFATTYLCASVGGWENASKNAQLAVGPLGSNRDWWPKVRRRRCCSANRCTSFVDRQGHIKADGVKNNVPCR
jgi:hypothetical protein